MSDFKKITVEHGQNLIDIAMQEYGSIIGLRLIIDDNNMSFDDSLQPGRELLIRKELVPNPDDSTNAGFYQDSVVQKNYMLSQKQINTSDKWIEEGRAYSSGFSFGF